MPVYHVAVRASLTKNYHIKAKSKKAAELVAHDLLSTEGDFDEEFEFQTVFIEKEDNPGYIDAEAQ